MAVPEQTPYKEYTANGSTTSFALGFICDSKNDLIVLVDNVAPPVATWSLVGNNAVFTTAPASGKKIVLQRNTAMSRTTNYQGNNNSFRPETINKDIDRVWLKLQELGVADMLLKIYVDRLHGEQKDYIDNKDQLVRNIIGDLRNYVNQQDGSLSLDINNLRTYVNQQDTGLAQSISILRNHTDQLHSEQKNYIDQQDNNRNSYFENLISRQGVSLQQLDSYYNYLMQRIAQISVDKGWDASFVVDGNLTQKEINDQRQISVKDYFTRAQLKDCLTGDPKLGYSDAFQAAVDDAIAKGSQGIFIPFDRGEIYNIERTINLNVGGFTVRGNRPPTYFRNGQGQTNHRGYLRAPETVTDFFNYNNGAGPGVYLSDQVVFDGVAAIGKNRMDGSLRTQVLLRHDANNNGPHRGILFTRCSAVGFDKVLYIVEGDPITNIAAASVVFEDGCVFQNNNHTGYAGGRSFGLRVSGIQSEAGSKFHGKWDGGVTICDNMLEGQSNVIDIDANQTSLIIENNYFEYITGDFCARLKGTTLSTLFEDRPNFISNIQAVDFWVLSGTCRVNQGFNYQVPLDSRDTLYTFHNLAVPPSKFLGTTYIQTEYDTGYSGTPGFYGFFEPSTLLPAKSSAVHTNAVGSDVVTTPFGVSNTGLIVTGTSGYTALNKAFAIGDVVQVSALIKVDATSAPVMQVYNDSFSIMQTASQLRIQPSQVQGWHVVTATRPAKVAGSGVRVRFVSDGVPIKVAAVGIDVTPIADFKTFNNTKRALVQIFNPFVPDLPERIYRANTSPFNIPLIDAGGSHVITSTLTVLGASVGDVVIVSSGVDMEGVELVGRVTSQNYVEVTAYNRSSTPVTLGSTSLKVRVIK